MSEIIQLELLESDVYRREILVSFKHKSMKEYLSGSSYTTNKITILPDDDDLDDYGCVVDSDFFINNIVDSKILDILELLYPLKNGSGYATLYQYEITKIDTNQYKQKKKYVDTLLFLWIKELGCIIRWR